MPAGQVVRARLAGVRPGVTARPPTVGDLEYHISTLFPQYGYLPHNGLIGLLAFNGVVGFFLLFALPVVGVFFAARAYHRAVRPDDRAAAVSAICVVASHLVQCFGDIGTTSWTSVFLLGPALAVVGKLATVTGAWPVRGSRLPCHAPAAQPVR